jgi:hypothetical protein
MTGLVPRLPSRRRPRPATHAASPRRRSEVARGTAEQTTGSAYGWSPLNARSSSGPMAQLKSPTGDFLYGVIALTAPITAIHATTDRFRSLATARFASTITTHFAPADHHVPPPAAGALACARSPAPPNPPTPPAHTRRSARLAAARPTRSLRLARSPSSSPCLCSSDLSVITSVRLFLHRCTPEPSLQRHKPQPPFFVEGRVWKRNPHSGPHAGPHCGLLRLVSMKADGLSMGSVRRV